MSENLTDEEIEDNQREEKLTKSSLEDFDYQFTDLDLAKMMYQEQDIEFYELDTAQKIVDS